MTDHDRELNDRGKRDAPAMAQLLSEQGLTPDAIISSTAKRARQTAQLVAEQSGFQGELQESRRLYESPIDDYLEVLSEVDDGFERVMLVAHNPTMAALVATLGGSREWMPTAAIAHIELPIDAWAECIGGVRGKLMEVWRPKEID